MKVKYAMLDHPHALSLGATAEEAAKVMAAFGVSVLPVIFEGRPVGIVTEHCLTTHVLAWAKDPRRTPVRQIMDARPLCLNENDSIELAKVQLQHGHEGHAFVCHDDGTLAGYISLHQIDKVCQGEMQSMDSGPSNGGASAL